LERDDKDSEIESKNERKRKGRKKKEGYVLI
jgi:hypothetical protein